MTSYETEIHVKQLEETATATTNQLVEVVRKLMLAGVGAMALTRDEAEKFTNMLVARGEIAQKDAEKLMNETMTKLRQTPPAVEAPMTNVKTQVDGISAQVENSFEQFLNRMNIPSKRDIDDLSTKIAMLTARVEELRRSQETPASRASKTAVSGEANSVSNN
jgi:poly(hydroxyalkanoate) granule-associated protein